MSGRYQTNDGGPTKGPPSVQAAGSGEGVLRLVTLVVSLRLLAFFFVSDHSGESDEFDFRAIGGQRMWGITHLTYFFDFRSNDVELSFDQLRQLFSGAVLIKSGGVELCRGLAIGLPALSQ